MNTDGSYTCICKPGCVGDGRTTCNGKPSSTHLVSLPSLYIFSPQCLLPSVDVNECNLTKPCGTGTCTNLVCGYSCSCQTGYQSYGPVANNVTCIGKSLVMIDILAAVMSSCPPQILMSVHSPYPTAHPMPPVQTLWVVTPVPASKASLAMAGTALVWSHFVYI